MIHRKPLVREVNPHLICVLCSGYFIEATTIVECLHSFCRSCLIKYLEKNKFCPICDVQLQKNNPLHSVRCDPTLQQLVYKLIPGLYAKEMARRRKYYSELGGGPSSSDSDNVEYPIPDVYFAPTDCISLSLEFLSGGGSKDEGSVSDHDEALEKHGVHHRRYLQCPAAVNVSHLKKFLRMKYDLSPSYEVEILHSGEVMSDEYSLMDVAYIFSWNKATPLRFQFRLLQKRRSTKSSKKANCQTANKSLVHLSEETDLKKETNVANTNDEEKKAKRHETNISNHALDAEDEEQRLEEDEGFDGDEVMERLEEDEVNQRIEEEALLEEEAMEEIDEEEVEEETPEPPKKEVTNTFERPNGVKRPLTIEVPKHEPEQKKRKMSSSPKIELNHFKPDEKRFLEDMIVEEDTDEDRLRISASEEEKSPDPQSEVEKVYEEKPRSEERRKKKSKKGKHHHRHRHHDRERSVSPPTAQIVHSPENDVLKLKVKLTAIKTGDNTVKGYTVSEGIDTRKEYKEPKENGHKQAEKTTEKIDKVKPKEEEYKKIPSPVTYNNRNLNNNNTINSNNNISNPTNVVNNKVNSNTNFCNTALAEFARKTDEINKEKLQQQQQQQQLKAIKKILPKINGAIKQEPVKMPPSSITVSKITAEEKRQMEQQKLLMNRNHSNGVDIKRPSLEIMLVNAPKKNDSVSPAPASGGDKPEVKKVMRPTPPSIPLSKLGKNLIKGSPPPLRAVRPDEALDLSGKSSRKSPDVPSPVSSPVADSLKIPLMKPPYVATPARPCKPNPTVRQIPNPSALMFRSHGRPPFPPAALPISSLRQMETMTKKIEKVAAGLTVKAAAAGGFK